MQITRSELSVMKEDQLRTKVLIPLFKAMKYKDVFHYHGGAGEQGKDIVMWRTQDFQQRVNYAVVVVAEPISGKATGNSSAGKIATQVQQAFGSTYPDAATREPQRVHRVLVVSSHQIKKEALQSIESVLTKSNLNICTSLISGDALWNLIEEHLNAATALDKLKEAGHILEHLDNDYRLIATTGKGVTSFSVQPKNPEVVKANPIRIKARLRFSQDEQGQKALQGLRDHLSKGLPVTILKPHIAGIEMPEFLSKVIGEPDRISFEPSQSQPELAVAVRVDCDDGSQFALNNIMLRRIRGGTEEVVATNDHQPIPWKFRLEFLFPKNQLRFGFTLNFDYPINVNRELEGLAFQEACSKPGVVRVFDVETGLEILSRRVPDQGGQMPEPPDPSWLQFVQMVKTIQDKTRIRLDLPSGQVAPNEAIDVYKTAEVLKNGYCTRHFKNFHTCPDDPSQIEQLTHAKPSPFMLRGDGRITILGQEVDLGPCVSVCERTKIRLTKSRGNDTAGTTRLVIVEPVGQAPLYMFYPKWLTDPTTPIQGLNIPPVLKTQLLEHLRPTSGALPTPAAQKGALTLNR